MIKKETKRILRGVIPYYFSKIFNPKSPNIPYYKYIREYGYARHLFDFRHEYNDYKIDIEKDIHKDLYFVLHKGRRLYFRKDIPLMKMEKMYLELLIEQDNRSAHHYFDHMDEVKGRTFLDIGSAEGFSSLDVIEEVEKVYLFEQDERWIEALNATFEPWQEKVQIIKKYISDFNDKDHQTLDDFFMDKSKNNLFLKMDIEGEERKALKGSKMLFNESHDLHFAICTYHENDDEKVISKLLNQFNCNFINQKGFFRHKLRSVVLRGKKITP